MRRRRRMEGLGVHVQVDVGRKFDVAPRPPQQLCEFRIVDTFRQNCSKATKCLVAERRCIRGDDGAWAPGNS